MSKVDIKALLEAGAHFGHRTSSWNPKMRPFIHSSRDGIHIINLEITVEQLDKAAEFTKQVTANGKDVLFVGTKKHIQADLKQIASEAGLPHVTRRWLGGTLTNFATISGRIKRYNQLIEQLESGELTEEYNKREILEFQEEKDKLGEDFSGVSEMKKLPGALFVADVLNEKTAVREANRLSIPVIGIVDSNADPTVADYPVVANDDARKTVVLIAGVIAEAAQEGVKEAGKKQAANKKKQEEDKKEQGTKNKVQGEKKSDNNKEEVKPEQAAEKSKEEPEEPGDNQKKEDAKPKTAKKAAGKKAETKKTTKATASKAADKESK